MLSANYVMANNLAGSPVRAKNGISCLTVGDTVGANERIAHLSIGDAIGIAIWRYRWRLRYGILLAALKGLEADISGILSKLLQLLHRHLVLLHTPLPHLQILCGPRAS